MKAYCALPLTHSGALVATATPGGPGFKYQPVILPAGQGVPLLNPFHARRSAPRFLNMAGLWLALAVRWREMRASAWFHKFAIVCGPTIPGPLPRGRGSEGSANKPLPGRMEDRYDA